MKSFTCMLELGLVYTVEIFISHVAQNSKTSLNRGKLRFHLTPAGYKSHVDKTAYAEPNEASSVVKWTCFMWSITKGSSGKRSWPEISWCPPSRMNGLITFREWREDGTYRPTVRAASGRNVPCHGSADCPCTDRCHFRRLTGTWSFYGSFIDVDRNITWLGCLKRHLPIA